MDACKCLLSILSDYIHKESAVDISNFDKNAVMELAKAHQLVAIAYESTSRISHYDNDEKKSWFNYVAGSIGINANQDRCLLEMKNYLEAHNIPYCVIKGKSVAAYYNKPFHRTMGDIDLVINSNDREAMDEYLTSIGFENKSKNINHEWVYFRGNIEIELHDKLVYPEVFNKKCEEEFFNNIWQHVSNNELESNFHFVYLLYHLKKHLTSCGVGFRQFLDLCLMWKNCKDLNRDRIISYLLETDMYDFARIVFSLCSKWFNDDTLYFFDEKTSIDNSTLEELTASICHNGVFGFNNSQNKDNVSVNNMRYCSNRFISMIHVIKDQCFPGYQNMVAIPKYQFIMHKKYLLPFAWVYRFIVNLKEYRVKLFLNKKLNFVSKERQTEREQELKKWNIID